MRTRAFLTPGERLRASKRGAARGMQFMADILAGKRTLSVGELRKVDMTPGMFKKNLIADGYVKWVFKAQGAVDQPWRQAAFMESVWEQAKVLAKGDSKQMDLIIERSVKAFDDGLHDDIILTAIADAEEAVFQNKSIFGQWISGIGARQ